MDDINPKGKYDENVNMNNVMDENNAVKEGGFSNTMFGTFNKASRTINAAHLAEIMSALEAGGEGHKVRNILGHLLGLDIEEVELHRVLGGKQVAVINDISGNQVEQKVSGGTVRLAPIKDLKPYNDNYYQYSASAGGIEVEFFRTTSTTPYLAQQPISVFRTTLYFARHLKSHDTLVCTTRTLYLDSHDAYIRTTTKIAKCIFPLYHC
jgi:hypothetical protein